MPQTDSAIKLYVVECFHDNDEGIYVDKDDAVQKLKQSQCAERVEEYELRGNRFEQVSTVSYAWWCEGCKNKFYSDETAPITWNTSYYENKVCSEECRAVRESRLSKVG